MIKLSVIIPARDEEGSIGLCLDQLIRTLGEKHRIPYEIVVVDDGSRDNPGVKPVRELLSWTRWPGVAPALE